MAAVPVAKALGPRRSVIGAPAELVIARFVEPVRPPRLKTREETEAANETPSVETSELRTRASPCASTREPAETVVVPVNVLAAPSVSAPKPVFVRPPEPVRTTPLNA